MDIFDNFQEAVNFYQECGFITVVSSNEAQRTATLTNGVSTNMFARTYISIWPLQVAGKIDPIRVRGEAY